MRVGCWAFGCSRSAGKQRNLSLPLTSGDEEQKLSEIKRKLTGSDRRLDVGGVLGDIIVTGYYKINSFHRAAS